MEKLLKKIYDSRKLTLALKIVSGVCVGLIVIAYVAAVLIALLAKKYMLLLDITVPAATGLVLVTIVRIFIGAPRPYELYEFYEVKPRRKKGKSFPSRHAYSAFVITVLSALVFHPAIVTLLAVLSVAVCVTRVLLGIHFIRDIVAGTLIGIIAGVLGILI